MLKHASFNAHKLGKLPLNIFCKTAKQKIN